MKKKILFGTLILGLVAFQYETNYEGKFISYHQLEKLNTSGGITSQTGAPGEQNCTGCHAGSVQDGNNGINLLTIDGTSGNTFEAGEVLTMNLTLTDATSKNGFQLVVLDENNEMAGSFTITDSQRTQLRQNNQLGRQYVTHTAAGTSSNSWNFEWNTPEEAGTYMFYLASNRTNANNGSSGDIVHLSNHTFIGEGEDNTTNVKSISKNDFSTSFNYLSELNQFKLEIENSELANITLNIIDIQGKSMFFRDLGTFTPGDHSEIIPIQETLNSGIYIATIFFNNRPVSHKFSVN